METSTAWPWALQVLKELPVLHVAPNEAWLRKVVQPRMLEEIKQKRMEKLDDIPT